MSNKFNLFRTSCNPFCISIKDLNGVILGRSSKLKDLEEGSRAFVGSKEIEVNGSKPAFSHFSLKYILINYTY